LWVRLASARAPATALEEGLLLLELVDVQGLNSEEIARRLARDKSWVSRRLDLVRVLPDSVQRLVVAGRVSPHSAMKVLVPVARANADHALILAQAIADGDLSTRDTEALYAYYRSGSPEVKDELLANPLRFLKAEKAYRSTRTGADTDEHDLLTRLDRLTTALAATTARARKISREGRLSPQARRLAPACALASQAMQTLMGVLALITEPQGETHTDDRPSKEASRVPVQGAGERKPVDREGRGSGAILGADALEGGSHAGRAASAAAQAHAASGPDSHAVHGVRSEYVPSGRGTGSGDDGADRVLDVDGLLPQAPIRPASHPGAGGALCVRAGRGAAARYVRNVVDGGWSGEEVPGHVDEAGVLEESVPEVLPPIP
jgi:ParB-like chromosome segregation protein Spo0J